MEHLGKELYAYCTDYVINLANIFNLSYYEINAILFCFLYPLLLVGLTVIQIEPYNGGKIKFYPSILVVENTQQG